MGEWTSYSDRADLPMSRQWREEMKSKLSKVDTSKLNAEQKRQYKKLWGRLNGDAGGSSGIDTSFPWILVLVGGAILAYWWKMQKEAPAVSTTSPSPIPVGSTSGAGELGKEAREARLRRFAAES